MKVKVFAVLRDALNSDEIALQRTPATVADLLDTVARDHPALAPFVTAGRILVAVNQELAPPDTAIRPEDEVCLLPPFSGGTGETRPVRIQDAPFSLPEEIAAVKACSRSIGAVVTFLGTARDLSDGKAVTRLDFEQYPGMAENALADLRQRTIREFSVVEVRIVHRTGAILPGDDIVLIAVGSAHRDEAFRACRFCIDELKRSVPIWKRETTADGETWVQDRP